MCKEKFINPFSDSEFEKLISKYTNRDDINALRTALWVGEERGRAEGRVKGRAEEKRNMALKMLEQNIDINVISTISGLSIDEIKSIQI